MRLVVTAAGADRGTLEHIIEKTRHACPYSRATLFLMSNDAVTDEVIHVDGGGRLV